MASDEINRPDEVPISELRPIDMSAHSRNRPSLQRLSDEELLRSVRKPRLGDRIVINTRTGYLHDGNGRASELLRRANIETSGILPDMLVPVEYYTPDLSMFPDLES